MRRRLGTNIKYTRLAWESLELSAVQILVKQGRHGRDRWDATLDPVPRRQSMASNSRLSRRRFIGILTFLTCPRKLSRIGISSNLLCPLENPGREADA